MLASAVIRLLLGVLCEDFTAVDEVKCLRLNLGAHVAGSDVDMNFQFPCLP